MKSRSARLLAILLALQLVRSAQAYGPVGHELVGAIADERLANTDTGRRVKALLGSVSLERASVMPDLIKSWDKNGPDDPKAFHYSAWPEIDRQLTEFWKANPPTHDPKSPTPSHHWFHYTDVPIMPAQTYDAGKAGRNKWDIVHMIPYCVDVLRGRVPEQNERKITKPIAVILLAHYLGDIHQPLHVGAAYFDAKGQMVDADKDSSALEDEGGNTFTIELSDDPPRTRGHHKKKFHGFWDLDAVSGLFPEMPEGLKKKEWDEQVKPLKSKLAHELAKTEPKNWRLPPKVDLNDYAKAWVDEILPIAREAHDRLEMRGVTLFQEENKVVANGEAVEKPVAPGKMNYRAWSTAVVREEIHKAGWRLADLLEQALKPDPAAKPAK